MPYPITPFPPATNLRYYHPRVRPPTSATHVRSQRTAALHSSLLQPQRSTSVRGKPRRDQPRPLGPRNSRRCPRSRSSLRTARNARSARRQTGRSAPADGMARASRNAREPLCSARSACSTCSGWRARGDCPRRSCPGSERLSVCAPNHDGCDFGCSGKTCCGSHNKTCRASPAGSFCARMARYRGIVYRDKPKTRRREKTRPSARGRDGAHRHRHDWHLSGRPHREKPRACSAGNGRRSAVTTQRPRPNGRGCHETQLRKPGPRL